MEYQYQSNTGKILYAFLVCILIAGYILSFVLFIYYLISETKQNARDYFIGAQPSSVPKLIWTYWHDLQYIPHTVLKCIDTWRKYNPDYAITILDNEKVKQLTGVNINELNISSSFYPRQSDIARLAVVAKFGGIWMDASIICTESFQWIYNISERTGADMIGFYAPTTTNMLYPIVENWFFAATIDNRFVNDWYKEVITMLSFPSEMDYLDNIRESVDLQNIEGSLPYLMPHVCSIVIQYKNTDTPYNTHFLNPVEGPFKYLQKHNWVKESAIEALCTDENMIYPIIKMRKTERSYIEYNGISQEQCVHPSISSVIKKNS